MGDTLVVGLRQNGQPIIRIGDEDAAVTGTELEHNSGGEYPSHSPSGFEWGYGGSGPAQLAYCLLEELFNHTISMRNYMAFKNEYVSQFDDGDGEDGVIWTLAVDEIQQFVEDNETTHENYDVVGYIDYEGETLIAEDVDIFTAGEKLADIDTQEFDTTRVRPTMTQ